MQGRAGRAGDGMMRAEGESASPRPVRPCLRQTEESLAGGGDIDRCGECCSGQGVAGDVTGTGDHCIPRYPAAGGAAERVSQVCRARPPLG